jgi:hypothetical protein
MTEQQISAAFPFESKFVAVQGSRMHYVEEDRPHEIGEAVAEWYRGLEGRDGVQPR